MNSTNYLFTIGALLMGGVCALVLAEVSVRVLRPIMSPQFSVESDGEVLISDAVLGHVITPRSIGHDERGFKNTEAVMSADIVALGDSHTYGVYGDEAGSWPAHLANKLHTSVYNMGVWGYGPVEYKALLSQALSLKPKTIVVALYMGNDVFNAYDVTYHRDAWMEYRSSSFVDASPVMGTTFKETHVAFQGVRDFFRNHLELYALLGDGTRLFREYVGLASPRTVGTTDWSTKDPDASLRYETGETTDTMFWVDSRIKGVDTMRPEIVEGLRITELILRDMQHSVRAQNIKFVVALIPSKESVYADMVHERGFENDTFSSIVTNEKILRDSILSLCVAERIHCIDMLPALAARIEDGEVVYRNHWDEHPLSEGYAAYAAVIAEEL